MTKSNRYFIAVLILVLLAGAYPLYMGASILSAVLSQGALYIDQYPKYVIPYTPISLALLGAALVLPLLKSKKHASAYACVLAMGIFLITELLLENVLILTTDSKTTLESWQMFMCYVPPDMRTTRTYPAIDVLMGEYSPLFKLHFYLISTVLILSSVRCIYGFEKMLRTNDSSHRRPLIIHAFFTLFLLALCILACFTAFFRDGELTVSPLSAALMVLFFITLSTTAGLPVASWVKSEKRCAAAFFAACAVCLMMYFGEMCLLSGHLYLLGKGAFFDPLAYIVLAPADIVVVLLSGAVCAALTFSKNRKIR